MTLALLKIKGIMFATVVMFVVLSWLPTLRIRLHKEVLAVAFYLIFISSIFCAIGAFYSTPGVMKQVQIYMLWPAMYTVLLAGCYDEKILFMIHRLMIFSLLFISLYGLILVLTKLAFLPEIPAISWLSFDESEGIGFDDDFIAMKFQGLNSLIFLIPYVLTSLILKIKLYLVRYERLHNFLLIASIFFGLIVVFMSGRRALILVLVMSLPLILLLNNFNKLKDKRFLNSTFRRTVGWVFIISFILFWFGGEYYELRFADFISMFVSGFDFFGTDHSASLRLEQWNALITGWAERPFFGSGHGASAIGSVRSIDMPWSYELYYVALLFQVGIVGLILYGLVFVWIFLRGVDVIKSGGTLGKLMFSSMIGLFGALIATATNPYLARFDGLWVIFFPISVINVWLMKKIDGNEAN